VVQKKIGVYFLSAFKLFYYLPNLNIINWSNRETFEGPKYELNFEANIFLKFRENSKRNFFSLIIFFYPTLEKMYDALLLMCN
jgi:hypothetical protein